MKYIKISLVAMTALLIASCSKEQDSNETGELAVKEVTVSLELPTGSAITADDLNISTILTDEMPAAASGTVVSTFDNNGLEMTFASNAEGKIVMLGYFNPISQESVAINAETTAVALIMLHPWTVDLSTSAKEEAMAYITTLPQFAAFKAEVANSIAGNLDLNTNTAIINQLAQLQQQMFARVDENKEPLVFSADKSKITLKNDMSSVTYGVGLYNSNDQLIGSTKVAPGLEKLYYTLNAFTDGAFASTAAQTIEFATPSSDGSYYLRAKSGRSADGSAENTAALIDNSFTLFNNILGMVSSGMSKALKNKACYYTIGEYVYNGSVGSVSVASSLQDFSNGNKSGYLLTKDVIYFIYGKADGVKSIIENCAGKAMKEGFFKKLFGLLDVTTKLESAFNSSAFLTDWIQYDKNIEFCFTRNGSEISACIPITGTWKLTSSFDETSQSETITSCFANNTLTFNANGTTFSGKAYKPFNDVCELESEYSGTYSIQNNTIHFSNGIVGGPVTAELVSITGTTLKLRIVDNGFAYLDTYSKQ